MRRIFVCCCGISVFFSMAFDSPARAEFITETLPTVSVSGGGSCQSFFPPVVPCPSATGSPVDFSLPQFNPARGTLTGIFLSLDAFTTGTATFTNAPIDCGGATICHNNAGALLTYGFTGSVSTGGSNFPVSATSPENVSLLAPLPPAGGTVDFGWSLLSDAFFFSQPAADPFVGNGSVMFTIAPTLSLVVAEADSFTVTASGGKVDAMLNYEYTPPAVPEPSLVAATGGVFGLLVLGVRRKSASAPPLRS